MTAAKKRSSLWERIVGADDDDDEAWRPSEARVADAGHRPMNGLR